MVMQPTTPQTPRDAPQIQSGDGSLITAANLQAEGAKGRNTRRDKANTTSIYTDVTEDVREFVKEMRAEFEQPAPYMKRKITPAQSRAKLAAMTPIELQELTAKYGVRRVAEFAKSIQRGTK